jgi:hypothetical protein
MTFDLLQQLQQQPEVDNFSRASLDVLSGFETTDDFELSANPTALRTELKVYVIHHEPGEPAETRVIGIKEKHLLSS